MNSAPLLDLSPRSRDTTRSCFLLPDLLVSELCGITSFRSRFGQPSSQSARRRRLIIARRCTALHNDAKTSMRSPTPWVARAEQVS